MKSFCLCNQSDLDSLSSTQYVSSVIVINCLLLSDKDGYKVITLSGGQLQQQINPIEDKLEFNMWIILGTVEKSSILEPYCITDILEL